MAHDIGTATLPGDIRFEASTMTHVMTPAVFLAELARRGVDVFVVDEQDLARELGDG